MKQGALSQYFRNVGLSVRSEEKAGGVIVVHHIFPEYKPSTPADLHTLCQTLKDIYRNDNGLIATAEHEATPTGTRVSLHFGAVNKALVADIADGLSICYTTHNVRNPTPALK